MATWNALETQFGEVADEVKGEWLTGKMTEALKEVSAIRQGRNVLLYGSAFLQKPDVPGWALSLSFEDINGLMACLHGMDWSKGLTVILHTPGGVTNATEAIVQYLRSKFDHIEAIVPTYAMSAGTMISLACDEVWLGNHSQLGPIDPQMPLGDRTVSARSVLDQFESAREDILKDVSAAHAWAPILQSMGPSLVRAAEDALAYSEEIVANWLKQWMLAGEPDPLANGQQVAHFFNDASTHKSHGRRIGRAEALAAGVKVRELEEDQALQEAVLTAYHLMTLVFTASPTTKGMFTSHNQRWLKNLVMS